MVEHPTDGRELKRIGGDGDGDERMSKNAADDNSTKSDISGVEIVWSDLDDALIVCRNVASTLFVRFKRNGRGPSSIDIEADLATNLIYREKCVALFEVWTEPTNTQDNIEFIKARGERVEFAESTGACGYKRLHFCFPEIKMRTSIDFAPTMKKKNSRREKSIQNWVFSRIPCASIASVQATRAPYLDILVVGEDNCVELYRHSSNNEDVPLCRLAILASDKETDQTYGNEEEIDVTLQAEVKCSGKVWGAIGNRVNIDVAKDQSRKTLRCILPGPPSDQAVRNVFDAMIESEDKSLLLRKFYERYPTGSLQADAEWTSFCSVAKKGAGSRGWGAR